MQKYLYALLFPCVGTLVLPHDSTLTSAAKRLQSVPGQLKHFHKATSAEEFRHRAYAVSLEPS